MHLLALFLEVYLLSSGARALPTDQVPLAPAKDSPAAGDASLATAKRRPLHGRFLHVTDFHPDKFYEVYSATTEDAACHRGQGPAGIYGAETSECDSPIALINKTFGWIEQEFKDKVDFVVWTGDSARHDNDDQIPRSPEQVTSLNKFMVNKMFEVFGKKDGDADDDDPNNDFIIPVVPNLGNNDVLPHNIMVKGPNRWTRTYADLWRQFIPEEQRHSFEQGGWFYVEVIPRKLAVFSINTLYFFQSNAAVDGCAAKTEPGYRQMEWLRIQLQFMRQRGMKAILTGHVPPARTSTKSQWDETCWQKYTLWLQQYRDVIIAGLWGHMNYDHFILQDFKTIDKDTKNGLMHRLKAKAAPEDDVHAELSTDYFIDLRNQWSRLPNPPKSLKSAAEEAASLLMEASDDQRPAWEVEQLVEAMKKGSGKKDKEKKKQKKYLKKIGGKWAENYAVSYASASVVPNLLPVVRVFEYNVTGLEDAATTWEDGFPFEDPARDEEDTFEDRFGEAEDDTSIETTKKKKKKEKPYKFIVPDPPSKSAPPGPAYSQQPLSLLGYTQYLANLTHINNDFTADNVAASGKWKEGKHKGKKPHDKDHEPNPKKFKFELHYDTRNDSVYHLRDLTIPSMLDLARRIGAFVPESELDVEPEGKKKHKKGKKGKKRKHEHAKENEAWYTFIRRAFVETMSMEEVEEEFGH